MSGYRELEIYTLALINIKEVEVLLSRQELKTKYWIADQIRRASLSIVLNIAEGYGRGTKKDFSHFISIAIGSGNEVVAILDVINVTIPEVDTYKVRTTYEELGKKLYLFRKYLLKK